MLLRLLFVVCEHRTLPHRTLPYPAARYVTFPHCIQIIHRRPALLVSKIETTVAAKFQQLQELFPDANVVSMVESDATVLLYDYTSVSVKVRMRGLLHWTKRRHTCTYKYRLDAVVCLFVTQSLCCLPLFLACNVFCFGVLVATYAHDSCLLSCPHVLCWLVYHGLTLQVDCWRERVSNVTELNQLIQDYPLLLSYSLDTSVSRLDFLIEVHMYVLLCEVYCCYIVSLMYCSHLM